MLAGATRIEAERVADPVGVGAVIASVEEQPRSVPNDPLVRRFEVRHLDVQVDLRGVRPLGDPAQALYGQTVACPPTR